MFQIVLMLHILGATIWTGGHLVLALTVLPRALRRGDPEIVTSFEEGFERLGIPALIVQVLTGLWLAHNLIPSFADWFSFTSYVHTQIAIKLALLLLTIMLAAHARLRIIPTLTARTLPALAWHVAVVTVLSVLFVLVGVEFRTGGLG